MNSTRQANHVLSRPVGLSAQNSMQVVEHCPGLPALVDDDNGMDRTSRGKARVNVNFNPLASEPLDDKLREVILSQSARIDALRAKRAAATSAVPVSPPHWRSQRWTCTLESACGYAGT